MYLQSLQARGARSAPRYFWSKWTQSMPGALIGTRLCKMFPRTALQVTLYSILIVVGWQLIHKV
ncbi:gsl3644 [Gloeobacter violaceus PCC 7421]|uniref:Gsl3644 protein n=1 Tax=Gloeobacter violaceus (strain ATCC 29082 / PCC 7421) TaxID=251221 RepID=Q7NF82_GLOVI|nr:gsl3644 [Gloeobacter violaceus PCC 7421]